MKKETVFYIKIKTIPIKCKRALAIYNSLPRLFLYHTNFI